MDGCPTRVFLASNNWKANELVPISRRLKNVQLITNDCLKAIKAYNQLAREVDRLNHRASCYTLDRKSKRNWLRLFIYFLNSSISNSFICYNQLAQDKLTYLNYMVSVAKSLCSGAEQINRGRPSSEKKPTKETRRCAYCSAKEAQVRSNIECFTCKLAFCFKDQKNCFFDYHTIFL
jgi:hypothetical protein